MSQGGAGGRKVVPASNVAFVCTIERDREGASRRGPRKGLGVLSREGEKAERGMWRPGRIKKGVSGLVSRWDGE